MGQHGARFGRTSEASLRRGFGLWGSRPKPEDGKSAHQKKERMERAVKRFKQHKLIQIGTKKPRGGNVQNRWVREPELRGGIAEMIMYKSRFIRIGPERSSIFFSGVTFSIHAGSCAAPPPATSLYIVLAAVLSSPWSLRFSFRLHYFHYMIHVSCACYLFLLLQPYMLHHFRSFWLSSSPP